MKGRGARGSMVLLIALALSACASPEATRQRAGGSGADVGNRRDVVRMHEGARPFWKTPRLAHVQGPPLEASAQADRLSR